MIYVAPEKDDGRDVTGKYRKYFWRGKLHSAAGMKYLKLGSVDRYVWFDPKGSPTYQAAATVLPANFVLTYDPDIPFSR